MYQRVMRSPFNRSENRQVMKCSEPIRASSKSRSLGLQAALNPARPDLGSFTTEGEGGAPRCKIVVRFARGMVRPCAEENNADLWRQEYRPFTQEPRLIPTSHASFARSRLLERRPRTGRQTGRCAVYGRS